MYRVLSAMIYREQEMSQAVDRPLRRSTTFWVLGVSESVFEFVSDSNSEFLVFFSSWTVWLYKEGYCPH